MTTFADFALAPDILAGVARLGFDAPTPVQESAIPLVLAGRDAIVQAKTGSGKTLAFGLPLLSMLKPKPKPQALVVLPTRELAIQVCESLASVCSTSKLRVLPIYGGVGLGPQESALAKGVDVVVGTPGRLKDLINRGSLDLGQTHMLVLDEADEMLDMGFRRDIDFLLARLPRLQQTLIFSATMPEAIEVIARKHLKNPEVVKLVAAEVTPSEITHYYLRLETAQRLTALITLLNREQPERAIIFTRMKHETKRLAGHLQKQAGIEAGFLNGNMSQNARNTMLARFRAGEFRYLVATDVAARGLHVDGLTHVIHYAVPTVVETYIHRSGRTGRAGASGQTITFVTPDAEDDFKAIRKRVALQPFALELPAALAVEEPAPPPPPRGGRQPRGRRPEPAREPRERQAAGAAQPRERQVSAEPAPRGRRPDAPAAAPTPGAWKRFKVRQAGADRQPPARFHQWLATTAGVDRGAIRSVRLFPDHVTFEVAPHAVDRLTAMLRRAVT